MCYSVHWGSLSREISVQRFSIQEGLYPGGLCLRVSVQGTHLYPGGASGQGVSLSMGGVSVQGGLYPRGGGSLSGRHPYGNVRAVRILLECILV